jgi:hypothetical protein
MRKSCENGQIFAKYHEISFRENIREKMKNSDFRENFCENIVKFSRKCRKIFAKVFEETKKGENVRKNLKTFSQKRKHKIF